jgi:uncharacterized phage infection (PIP) family protein YhgE
MSINEKINQELETLQKELDQLHHYSVQIGEANDAATNLSKATLEFVTQYGKQVAKVTGALDEAAGHFTTTTKAVSNDFVEARNSFRDGIEEAGGTFREGVASASTSLGEVETRLAEAAKQVELMSSRLDTMNIPEQFRRVQDSLLAIERQLNVQGSDFSARLTGMESGFSSLKGKLTLVVYLLIGIGILVAAGVFLQLV